LPRSGTTYWGSELSEPFADGQLEHLMIVDHLSFSERGIKTDIVFWVTPTNYLLINALLNFLYWRNNA